MTGLEDHEGDLAAALAKIGRSAMFAELVAQRWSGESVQVDSKTTTLSARPRLQGVVFRAWAGGHWQEAAASALAGAELESSVTRLASELARASGGPAPPGAPSTSRGEWTTHPRRALRDLGAEGTISLAKQCRDWALAVPGIGETQVRLSWDEEQRLYLNTAGARCYQAITRTHGLVVPIAMEGGRPEFDYWNAGGVGGLEVLGTLDEPTVRGVAEGSKAMLAAKAPPAGAMDVLLDPSVGGLFAHESFGHGTEADQFVRDRSYLKPILGQQVGPESLTLVDDGSRAGAWGSIYCDDEGHRSQRTVLVDRGRFVGALHDRETAALLHATPTGNTRRADFLSRAFVRMTNTFVEPGDRSFEELISEVDQGVLLEHGTSGIEDPLGGQMQLKVKKGHRIEHGKLTDLVGSMALSGKVLDFLREIKGVGTKEGFVINPGFCGKGHSDYVPAGTGGVYLLSHAIVGTA